MRKSEKYRPDGRFAKASTTRPALPWTIEMRGVNSLKSSPRNARTHNDMQVDLVVDSMSRFGVINPVIVDSQGSIVAGHARWAAAKKMGLRWIPVILVSNLSEEELRAYALADNQIATRAGWNRELLAIELAELQIALPEFGLDLSITGFDPDEIDSILEDFGEVGALDDDAPQAVDGPVVARNGDIILLGSHRLLVGDARDRAAFARLMQGEVADMGIHDPPYNVRVQGNVGGRGRTKRREFLCASGEMNPDQFTNFLTDTLGNCSHNSRDGAIHYVFMDHRHLKELLAAGATAFDEHKQTCAWIKNNAGQGSFYRSQFELVLVFKHGRAPHLNNFGLGGRGRTRSNVWRYASPNMFRMGRADAPQTHHPTVKPVAMIADAMRDCSKRDSIILDAFAGSGTTIMAAEQIGRRAYCMEIDPIYADVAVRRWQAYTKRDAVFEESGQTFGARSKTDGGIIARPADGHPSASESDTEAKRRAPGRGAHGARRAGRQPNQPTVPARRRAS